MKAGKRTSEEIKLFLDASYQDKPPETIGDWILDKSISNKTGKVYYNPKTKEAVVAHRGTKGAKDWINNIAYVTGTYKHTTRYKRGKNLQNKAEAKYGKENISTLAHSQGAVLARDLGADTKEVINVNPAYLGEETADNEYNIKSSSDIVSGLYPEIEGKDIVIPSENPLDIIGEHSYNILDRLDDNELIGQGLKSHHYNIMTFGGRRCQELGYSVDDIDWINGGVRDIGKALRRGMRGVNKELSKANPLGYKGVQNVGAKMGDITNNYLLPAVVSAGKPMLDVTAMGASTMLTGNPVLGKAVSDIAWREGVQKTGNDPRERQKSKTLGELSGVAGQTGSKFLGFGRKKKGGSKKPTGNILDEELNEIFGRITFEDEKEDEGGRPKAPTPKAPKATGKRKEAEEETKETDAMEIDDEEPEEPRRIVKAKRGKGRKMKGGVTDPTIPTKPSRNPSVSEIMGSLNRTWQGIRERENQAEYNAFVRYLNEQLRNVRDARLRQEITDFRNNIHDAWELDRNPESSDTSGDEEEHPRQRRRVGNGRKMKGGVRSVAEKKEARKMEREDKPSIVAEEVSDEPVRAEIALIEDEPEEADAFEAEAMRREMELQNIEDSVFSDRITPERAIRATNYFINVISHPQNRSRLETSDYRNLVETANRMLMTFEMIMEADRRTRPRRVEEDGSIGCVASGRKGGKYPSF